MSSDRLQTRWLVIDHKDVLERELSGGFSMFERKGSRELVDRPRCPICPRYAFPKAVVHMEKVRFTGDHVGDASWGNSMTFLVSQRFVRHWHDAGLTGLEFSDEPVNVSFKRKTTFTDPSREFFLAIPEPRITQFADEAEAVYTKPPPCQVCSALEVNRLARLVFQPATLDGTDCCLPSCLPGWLLVSSRFRRLIEEHCLMNFTFLEAFQRLEDRTLIRKGYWWQHQDGQFERFPECSEDMAAELRGRWRST